MVATPLFKKKEIKFWSPRRDPGCDRWQLHWGLF